METNETASEQLHQVERLQTVPWVDYPPTPNWYFPVAGTWFAAMCLTVVNVGSGGAGWFAVLGVLLTLEAAFIVWSTRRRAATPNLRTIPKEFKPLVKWFVLAAVAILALTIALVSGGFETVGVIVGALLGTAGLYVYEKKFETAAEIARARLELT